MDMGLRFEAGGCMSDKLKKIKEKLSKEAWIYWVECPASRVLSANAGKEISWLIATLEQAQAEVGRLQKGIAVSIAYCDIYYCGKHQDWRIQGYTFGCGDKHG